MQERSYWRKAISLSLALHGVLLLAGGSLVTIWPTAVPAEEMVIEMNLAAADEPWPAVAQEAAALAEAMPAAPAPSSQATSPVPADSSAEVSSDQLQMTEAVASTGGSAVSGETPRTNREATGSTRTGGNSASGIAAPRVLSKTEPEYPTAARRAGQEGTVVLRIEILTNGQPGSISVAQSSGSGALDAAGIAALRQWRFIPAQDRSSGKAVVCTTTLPVSFRLHTAR